MRGLRGERRPTCDHLAMECNPMVRCEHSSHRIMAKLFQDRGVHLDRTYQLNVGGNMDFKNMLERDRLESKKISKTNSVTSQLHHDLGEKNVHIGPSDYIPWLDDRKWAYVRLEGRAFGDVPLNLYIWEHMKASATAVMGKPATYSEVSSAYLTAQRSGGTDAVQLTGLSICC